MTDSIEKRVLATIQALCLETGGGTAGFTPKITGGNNGRGSTPKDPGMDDRDALVGDLLEWCKRAARHRGLRWDGGQLVAIRFEAQPQMSRERFDALILSHHAGEHKDQVCSLYDQFNNSEQVRNLRRAHGYSGALGMKQAECTFKDCATCKIIEREILPALQKARSDLAEAI
jgi:hypothetical protein